jgi:hypothetical protein
MDEMCMFCLKAFEEEEVFVALLKPYARELLGTAPPRRARGPRDPQGRRRWLAHEQCVRGAVSTICMYCQGGLIYGDEVVTFPQAAARRLLGEEPPERSATTIPDGRPRHAAHRDCATAAGVDTSGFRRQEA